MKHILLLFSFLCYVATSSAQIKRNIEIYPYMDTTHSQFKEIFIFWKSYMDELNLENLRNGAQLNKMPESLKKYWAESETNAFDFPDLAYTYLRSKGSVWYTNDNEYFLGVTNRGNNLFQIKTLFNTNREGPFKGFPSVMLTIYVRQTSSGLQLENTFTHNMNSLIKYTANNITYYYPNDYAFADSISIILNQRVEQFKKGFKIENTKPIIYVLSNRLTDVSQLFGIVYNYFDYGSVANTIQGGYTIVNNMVFIGGGGENYLHEILHILLSSYERGSYSFFEEGIATYFGEHVGKTYNEHMPDFKSFLAQNEWIDLTQSFYGYFKNPLNNRNDTLLLNKQTNLVQFRDLDSNYNFQYMVHAALCDIAFNYGGYEKVKGLYLCKADNEEEFYKCIEDVLNIKRANLNDYLRE